MTSSPLWLEWYFSLDITPNSLRFSIYPAEAYTESVKALDDQNQSILIVVSISGVSLRLRPNTPTLIADSHRHIVILPMGFRGVNPERSCFPYHRWNTTSYYTCMSIIYPNIWELCRCVLTNAHKCNTSLLRIYRCPISIILWLGIFNDYTFVDWYCRILSQSRI